MKSASSAASGGIRTRARWVRPGGALAVRGKIGRSLGENQQIDEPGPEKDPPKTLRHLRKTGILEDDSPVNTQEMEIIPKNINMHNLMIIMKQQIVTTILFHFVRRDRISQPSTILAAALWPWSPSALAAPPDLASRPQNTPSDMEACLSGSQMDQGPLQSNVPRGHSNRLDPTECSLIRDCRIMA